MNKMSNEELSDMFIQAVIKSLVETMEKTGMRTISRYELTRVFARGRPRHD